MKISNHRPLSKLVLAKGVATLETALAYLRSLPYGRTSNRIDLSLVMMEQRGSCSSKHAFLKQLAIENDWSQVKLFIGMYAMNEQNTPGIGTVLTEHQITAIPEAHCYVKINGTVIDITSPTSSFDRIKDSLLEEIEIEPSQVADFKVKYHQKFMKNWLQTSGIKIPFDKIWELREQCIKNLSILNKEA